MYIRAVRLSSMSLALAVLGLLGALAPAALADGEGIQVISEGAESHFPDDITFKIAATSPDPITEVRVFFSPVGGERSGYGYLDIEPGTRIEGEHLMALGSGTGHKPPGTVVRYFFEIIDAADRELRTEEKEFLYLDESLAWKQISDGILTVFYYGDFVEKRARTVLETAKQTMDNMGRLLGIIPTEPIKIVSYSNYRDMSRGLPFRSQAVREGLQTQGQAWPSERVLLVLSSEATVTGIASHEFTHILVAEAAGRGYTFVPAWLNEGLAEFGNIDQTPAYDRALAYAIFTRRVKPLWYQQSLGGEPDDIVIGYGQGKSVVEFLINTYGPGKMADLMRAFHSATSVDGALQAVYSFDQYGLDTLWRRSLGLGPLPSPQELVRQLTPTPSPSPASEEEDPTPVPTPLVEETPAPVAAEATPESPAATEEEGRTSRSCGASPHGDSDLPLDVAMVGLLGAPLFALRSKWGRGGPGFVLSLSLLRRPRDRRNRESDRLNGPWG